MHGKPTTSELMDAIIDLHAAVGTGFARVDARFERLEGRVGALEVGLTGVRGEVAGLQRWMAQSEGRFEVIERALEDVRGEVKVVVRTLEDVRGEVKGLQGWMMQSDRRFAVLEQRL